MAHTDPKTQKAQTIANLETQKAVALSNGDTKTAALIEKIIRHLSTKK